MTRDRAGATVLHKAAANPDPSVLRLLLQTGAAPYLRDGDGRCPLTAALLLGNQEAALVMLEEVGRCLHGRRAARAGTAQPRMAAPGKQLGPTLSSVEPKLYPASTHPAASDSQAGHPDAGAPPQGAYGAAAAASEAVLAADAAGVSASHTSTAALTAALARLPTGEVSGGGGDYDATCARIDSLPDETLDMIVAAAVAAAAPQVPAGCRDGLVGRSWELAGAGATAGAAGGVVGLGQALPRAPSVFQAPTRPLSANVAGAGLAAGDAAAAVLRVLSSTSSRLRAACRRFELYRWTSRDSLSAPVARYHPRWQHTTLLHLAAAQGMEEVAVRLMQRGSRVDAIDSCGRTPLEEARVKNQPMMVALLLSCERQREEEDDWQRHGDRTIARLQRGGVRGMAG
jgi:hypothetical protein